MAGVSSGDLTKVCEKDVVNQHGICGKRLDYALRAICDIHHGQMSTNGRPRLGKRKSLQTRLIIKI